MCVHNQVQRVFLKLGKHAGRMADANGFLARGNQPLKQVIDGQIARSTGQHSLPPTHRLANQFHDGRRFSRSGRTMNDRHVLGCQTQLDCLNLRLV
jgi:hypothetical protein